ncbi:hypothetical protein BS50DRAFT_555245 [Corynespora cassiicola Philippines]|uniref:Tyrosine specific protein phosphatases domain-containing protein n=1 Tax=Corynespora cassiicola Philippines TaxID=1448308 RepID=A0A2T2NHQ1_CORCC|nr:hypothetical protein BS50DRAFT_555245 [Corynespora cassiicola Philippines]
MEPHSHRRSIENGTLRLPQALVLLLRSCLAGSSDHAVTQAEPTPTPLWQSIRKSLLLLVSSLNPFVDRGHWTSTTIVGMVKLTALCGLGTVLWQLHLPCPALPVHDAHTIATDPVETDPGLLKKHSNISSYTVPSTGFTYPGIRTFYKPHNQDAKLPQKPSPVPLLVFIHGLGGSAAQFHPILLSLSNLAPCLAVDLPGCGLSSFEPQDWSAYTTEALVKLLAVIIEAHRNRDGNQSVVLIGHSMGCSLAALLASSTSPYADLLSDHVSGFIAICPKADPPTEAQCKAILSTTRIPTPLFNLFRKWDRRGGISSKSVLRMTGPDANEETRKLQLRFNRQSRTGVWRRMARGMCPDYSSGTPTGGLPGREVWAGLRIPVFLVAGEMDTVTPPENVKRIVKFLGRDVSAIGPPSEKASLPIAAAPFDPAIIDPELPERKHHDSGIDAADLPKVENDATAASSIYSNVESLVTTEAVSSTVDTESFTDTAPTSSDATPDPEIHAPLAPHDRRLVVKTSTMPKPAAHSLLFSGTSSRIISGLMGSFLADHVDPRLSLAWQLQYLSTEGKWDVKNLEKWKAVQPVSLPIANVFRAMKTLREVDEKHSPKKFVSEWANKIRAVIDISHDSPVYDPKGLSDGGIEYHKFPTVSKHPPTVEEVQDFIRLVDEVRSKPPRQGQEDALIGVHCHYGFNRTGFFLVSYMVERLNFKVEEAIDTFQQARPPGIRHSHFIDTLHVRYCTGLKKAPTL